VYVTAGGVYVFVGGVYVTAGGVYVFVGGVYVVGGGAYVVGGGVLPPVPQTWLPLTGHCANVAQQPSVPGHTTCPATAHPTGGPVGYIVRKEVI
jgi:hypothetical protein